MSPCSCPMDTSTTVLVFIVLCTVQMVFAVWPVAVKMAFEDGIGVFELSLARDVFACFCLWLAAIAQDAVERRPIMLRTLLPDIIGDRTVFLFMLLGICSFANSFGYIVALLYVTPFNSSLLHPTIPVFASVMGAVVGVSHLTHTKVLGTTICIVGSVLVVLCQPSEEDSESATAQEVESTPSLFFGNMLLVAQSLAMATLLVFQKFVPSSYSPLKITALYYSVGTALSLPVSLITISLTSGWVLPTPTVIGCVLFGSIFVVGFNYAALSWVNKILSPTIPAASMMLQPPFSYFASRAFVPGPGTQEGGSLQVSGGLVIVVGLLVALCDRPAPPGSVSISNSEEVNVHPDVMGEQGADKGAFLYTATPHEAEEVKSLLRR